MIYKVLISIENLEVTFEENEGMYCKVTEVSVRWGGGGGQFHLFFTAETGPYKKGAILWPYFIKVNKTPLSESHVT